MSYAIKNDGQGWRAVNGAEDILPNETFSATQPMPTAEQITAEAWAAYQQQSLLALEKSDMVALRCVKAGVAFPSTWQTFVAKHRAIVAAATGDPTAPQPVMPAYPAGT